MIDSGDSIHAVFPKATSSTGNAALVRQYAVESVTPDVPQKIISEGHKLIDTFRSSASFQKILSYVQGCAEAIQSTANSQRMCSTVESCCAPVRFLATDFFPALNQIVSDIPLEDMAKQRFGNRAKRQFHAKLDEIILDKMKALVRTLPPTPRTPYDVAALREGGEGSAGGRSEAAVEKLAAELTEYVKDSFGNPIRLDYGTGHELHFFVVLMICLEECGDLGGSLLDDQPVFVPLHVSPPAPVPAAARDAVRRLRQEFILYAFDSYMQFVRRLQKHYSLEPAGSHGVWGLDDYHHLSYVFGGSQLIDKENGSGAAAPILTKYICDKGQVETYKDEYMYFGMIAWIQANKTGPFSEHSNMLYNISGVEHWAKIYQGMVKMMAGEVLAKFNVSQHLLFGPHLPWNTKEIYKKE